MEGARYDRLFEIGYFLSNQWGFEHAYVSFQHNGGGNAAFIALELKKWYKETFEKFQPSKMKLTKI